LFLSMCGSPEDRIFMGNEKGAAAGEARRLLIG